MMAEPIAIETVEIKLGQVRLRPDVVLDDVRLSTTNVQITLPPEKGEKPTILADETRFSGVLTEPSLNALIAGALANNASLKNIQVALLTDKAKITGQYMAKFLPLPFTVEAIPFIENGVRVMLDFRAANAAVFSLPASWVDILETNVNGKVALDLGRLPFPVWLDTVRCEPGRLVLEGKAKLGYPLIPVGVQNAIRDMQ